MIEEVIVKMKFGSHLYGTNTDNSDIDMKQVFIPSSHDIIMQRVVDTYNTARPKNFKEKNYAGEEECESFSLQKFLNLASQGQTVTLDMLFAPESAFIGTPRIAWRQIQENRSRLLTKKSISFISYCRQQANKYGIKGSRVASARKALDLLKAGLAVYGGTSATKLSVLGKEINELCAKTESMSVIQIEQIGGQIIDYWDVCGRKLQYTAPLKHAHDVVENLVREYGGRALQAEKNEGVDWKALSHAVRIGRQALELLESHFITFPLPYKDDILDIKLGKRDYKRVAQEIEDLLEKVEAASLVSTLPDEVDQKWIDQFVYYRYRDQIPCGAAQG